MKKMYYLILCIGFFACSQENYLADSEATNTSEPSLKFGGDGKYDALGHGVDITLAFLATERASVIDNLKVDALPSSRISPNLNNLQTYFEATGATASSFLKEITSKKQIDAGLGWGVFSASFKGTFDNQSKETYTNNYSFGEYNLLIQKAEFRYTFGTGTVGLADMRECLTDNFKADLIRKSPQEIIQIYGTHIYTHVKLGGRLNVRYSSEISSYESETTKKNSVTGDMGIKIPNLFKFNASGSIINTEHSQLSTNNRNQKIWYQTKGGDARKALIGTINLAQSQQQIDITAWQTTCTRANANLIDFDPGTLLPIWELVENPSKQASLKTAIIQYIKDKEFKDTTGPIVYPDRLRMGEYLYIDQPLFSLDKRYKLVLQGDRNLVLYNTGSGKGIWSTNNYNTNIKMLVLQTDGNLVLRDQSQTLSYWSSGTHRIGNNATLVVQNDGNLVLYDYNWAGKWSSNTVGK